MGGFSGGGQEGGGALISSDDELNLLPGSRSARACRNQSRQPARPWALVSLRAGWPLRTFLKDGWVEVRGGVCVSGRKEAASAAVQC